MVRFNYDKEKTITSLLFILNKLGAIGFHKLFKILYFADQKHLVNYGIPITGDIYIAMKNGPVPSVIYDTLKEIKKSLKFDITASELNDFFEVKSEHFVAAKRKADIEFLSETEWECLEESIKENCDLQFDKLEDKSHKAAWSNTKLNNKMSYIDIAIDGGASEIMLDYIKMVAENQGCTFS